MMTPKEAAAWLRMDSQDQREAIKGDMTAPSVNAVDVEWWRRRNEAMDVVLTFAEDHTCPYAMAPIG